MELLSESFDYAQLASRTCQLAEGLKQAAERRSVTLSVDSEGGMFGFASVSRCLETLLMPAADVEKFMKFSGPGLDKGEYLPFGFWAGFSFSLRIPKQMWNKRLQLPMKHFLNSDF